MFMEFSVILSLCSESLKCLTQKKCKMDKKNLLHTERVNSRNKTIFLDLKESEAGSNYLVITESRQVEENKYERNTLVLFENELQRFSESLTRVLIKFSKKDNRPSEEEITEMRKTFPRAYESWTKADDDDLRMLVDSRSEIDEMIAHLQRAEGAIRVRIRKLKLTEYPQTAEAA